MSLPPELQGPFNRFTAAVSRPDVEPEPDTAPTAPPPDSLIRLALTLEPYARFVIHKRDARQGDLYVGRPTLWGNSITLAAPDDDHERLRCVNAYARHFAARSGRQQMFMLAPIRRIIKNGYRLACYCSPRTCHAQVLAAWAMGTRITPTDLEDV